jgi:cytoskeleton protein RodZ
VIDVGSELAQARKRRTLSLTELARRTKISEATLRAIERNDAKELPRGIFMRGFLRAYAREVGCDPEEIVVRYLTQFEDQEVEGNETRDQSTANLKARCDPDQVHSADMDDMDRRGTRAQVIGTLLTLLFGGMLYFSFGRTLHPAQPSSDPSPVDAPTSRPVAEAAPVEVGTGGSSVGPKSIDAESNGLRVDIQSRGLCWLSGTADGQRVIYRLLNAGERTQIEAHEDLVLRIGDAASFEFTVNGAAARPLGSAGQAVTIHLTRKNYQTFLKESDR